MGQSRRATGRGSRSYDVFVSEDGGPYTLFENNTALTSGSFTGAFGHSYAFYSVATDYVGLAQPTPNGTQPTTFLSGPPTSTVSPLPTTTPTTTFPVTWTGTPGQGATSIAMYEVLVAEDSGPFTPYIASTTSTSTTFTGAFGHAYAFYTVATDNLGGVQATPTGGQAKTRIVAPPTSSVNPLLPTTTTTSFPISWSGSPGQGPPASRRTRFWSPRIAGSRTPLVTKTTETSTTFTGGQFGHTYHFYSLATDNFGDVQPTPTGPQASTYLAGLPTSSVNSLPNISPNPSFTVSWSGTPGSGASSIASYTVRRLGRRRAVQYSHLHDCVDLPTTFNGTAGHTYQFYSVATDNLGDQQPTPTASQASTTVAGAPTSTVTALPTVSTNPSITLSWSGSPGSGGTSITSYTIYDQDDGGPFTAFLSNTTLTSTTFNGTVGHTYGFFSVATNNAGRVQPTLSAAQSTTPTTVAGLLQQHRDPRCCR